MLRIGCRGNGMQHLRGKFIVLDGPEGSGKSTQLQMLRGALEKAGLDVLAVWDTGAARIGQTIPRILLESRHSEKFIGCGICSYIGARGQRLTGGVLSRRKGW